MALLWGTAWAESSSLQGLPIQRIGVLSRVSYSPLEIGRITGLSPGKPYSTAAVRQGIEALYRQGLYKDIQVEAHPVENGVELKFVLIERTFLQSVEIGGNRSFMKRELSEPLGLKDGQEFTDPILKAALDRLIRFYHRQGYLQVKIQSETISVPRSNRVRLRILVNEGVQAKIKELRFSGNRIFPDLRLHFAMRRSGGGEFYNAEFLERNIEALRQLYQSKGYELAIVGPPEVVYIERSNEVAIHLPIEAGMRIEIAFEGERLLDEGLLRREVLIHEEHSYEDSVIEASARKIERFYRSKGYWFVEVGADKRESIEHQTVLITFKIRPGKKVCLRAVRFLGADHFPEKRLHDLIQTRAKGWGRCGTMDPEQLDRDRRALRQFYLEQGFTAVQVEHRLVFDETETRVHVIFPVREGVQTRLVRIKFKGNERLAQADLVAAIALKAGQPYFEPSMRIAVDQMQQLYHRHGFVYAEVVPSVAFSEDRTQATVTFAITESIPVRIGRIFIQGQNFTQEYVIRRELTIHPNDLYDEERFLQTRQRLFRLGYLADVRIEPILPLDPIHPDPYKDLRVTVQERPAGAFEFGGGYGTEERLRGFAELSHRNLFGTGRAASLRAEGSTIHSKYSLNYKEPWFLNRSMDARAGAALLSQQRETFTQRTTAGTVGVDKSFTDRVKGSLIYQYEHNKISTDPDVDTPCEERVNIGSLNPSLIRDSRDDPFNPTRGSVNGILIRDAALLLGSDVQLVKTTMQTSWYLPILPRTVLAVSARGGLLRLFGETAKLLEETAPKLCSERFFLGGLGTVRGYERDRVGVLGQTLEPDGTPIGGNAMVLFNGELRFTLAGGLGLVGFVDSGNVWSRYTEVDLDQLKTSVGGGLRYRTPVGPFRLDYGYKLDRETAFEESAFEWHFTLGHAF
jgi:outer membrane protein insertion porin family